MFLKSSKLEGTGRATKCSLEMASELPEVIKNSFNRIPTITATNAPGTNFKRFRKLSLSQEIRIVSDTRVMIIEPIWI
ncbi:hypothetical protein D9M72_470730 [compost metagenome]